MKLCRRHPDRGGVELNIASLIDVILLLIIFFMTVSQVTRIKAEPVKLPRAGQGSEDREAALQRVVITVRRDGSAVIAGRVHSEQQIEAILVEEKQHRGSDRVFILIRGDRDVPWQRVEEVLAVCSRVGILQVKVAVEPQGPPGDGG